MINQVEHSPQQTQLDLALKMARVAFWEFDMVQSAYILNDQAYAVLRTSAEQEGGYIIPADEFAQRFIHPDDVPLMAEAVRQVLQAADPDFVSEREYRVLFGDGQTGYLTVLFKGERDENGRVTRLYGTGQDITRRWQAEEELKLNKIQFKTLFDTASDDIELLDPQANIVDCNDTHAQVLGYGRDELIGQNVTRFFTEDTVKRFEEKSSILLEKGYFKCEMGLRCKDGSIMRVWRQVQAVKDDDGHLKGILIHNRDIMDPYMIKEQLELQNIALKASASAIVITDDAGTIQWANPAIADLTGYTPEEIIGQNPRVLKSGVHDETFYNNMWQTLTRGEVWRSEIINRRKDGTLYTEEMTITPVRARGDEITNFIAIKQDITKRKEAEAALAKQVTEMQTVAEVSTAAATIRDTNRLLQVVVDLAKARFELYHAHIYLLNEPEDRLVLTVGAGEVGQQMVAQEHSIPLNQEKSLVAQAARTRQSVIENDVLRNPAFLPNPLLLDTRSEMAVPMMVGDRVVGVLDVQADKIGRFTSQDIVVKTALAAQVAVALENARSYEQARTSLAETEALLDITRETSRVLELKSMLDNVLDRVLATTNFDIGLISVVNPDSQKLELGSSRLPEKFQSAIEENGLDGSLCELVYRRRENIIIVDTATDAPADVDVTGLLDMGYQSYQGVPLESKGMALGTLCIFSRHPLASARANRVFLQAVGQQVGTAIRNAALFEQTQAALAEIRVREAELAHAMDMAGMATWDLDYKAMIFTFNDRFYNLMHIAKEDVGGYQIAVSDYLSRFVHPEDGEIITNALKPSENIDPDFVGQLEYRALRGDGEVQYVELQYQIERDEEGNALKVHGSHLDVTQRKRAEEALARQARELSELTRRLTREGWQDYLDQTTSERLGYVFDSSEANLLNPISEAAGEAILWAGDGNGAQSVKPLIQPIVIHGETVGQLAIMPEDDEDEVDPETAEIIRSVIEQLGARIENLRLTEQAEGALMLTDRLYRANRRINAAGQDLQEAVAAIAEAVPIPDVNRLVLFLFEYGAAGELEAIISVANWYSGEGAAPPPLGIRYDKNSLKALQILESATVVIVADVSNDERLDPMARHVLEQLSICSLAALPLWRDDRQIGCVLVETKVSHQFTEQELEPYEALAGQLALAVDRQNLLDEAQSRAQREQMLRQITQRIRSSADVETIMRTAVQEIGRTLGRKTYIYLGDDREA